MAQKRPYIFTRPDRPPRMIEALSPAAAIAHGVGGEVGIRAATGAEVAAWHKAGQPVETAGEKPVEVKAGDRDARSVAAAADKLDVVVPANLRPGTTVTPPPSDGVESEQEADEVAVAPTADGYSTDECSSSF